MKPNEPSMTLRQRYEAQKTNTAKLPTAKKPFFPSYLRDDSFLGELVGRPITVTFMNGEETSGTLNAFYRFAIKLNDGQVIFKHSIRTVCPAGERNLSLRSADKQGLEETTEGVLH